MKKISAVICCLLMLVTCFSFVSCKGDEPQNEVTTATTYVTMDINPSIELVADQNNKVISVYAANEDAEVLLYGEEGILNVDIDIATEKILSLAIEYGYLNEENSGVGVSVVSENEEKENNIETAIQGKISSKSTSVNFDIKFTTEDSFSIQRQLEKMKADSKYSDLTSSQLKLILAAMACDTTLTFDEAYAMSTEDLLVYIQHGREIAQTYCDEVYTTTVKAAELAYNKAVEVARATAFTTKYVEILDDKTLAQKLTVASAAVDYAKYVTADYALQGYILAEKHVGSYEVTPATATAIAEELGVEITVLQNDEGKVTISSVENYIDRIVKNAIGDEKENIEAKYATLMEKLDEDEAAAETENNKLEAATINWISAALETLSTEFESLGIDLMKEYNLEDVEGWIVALQEKEDEALETMMAILTDDEKNELEVAQDEAEAKLSEEKAEFDETVAKAKTDIDNALKAKKEARKQA